MWTSFYANVLDTGVFMYKRGEVGVRHTIRLHLLTLDLWERPGCSLAFLRVRPYIGESEKREMKRVTVFLRSIYSNL